MNSNLLCQHVPQMRTAQNKDSNQTCNEQPNKVYHDETSLEQNPNRQMSNNPSNDHENNLISQTRLICCNASYVNTQLSPK